MYEEALLPPQFWLTVDTHLVHEANGCNYPLDSSEISNDEHPKDEMYDCECRNGDTGLKI